MCGRYSETIPAKKLADRFGLVVAATGLPPRYNIAPTQDAPVVVREERNLLKLMRWGLIPSWAKASSIQRQRRVEGEALPALPVEGAYPIHQNQKAGYVPTLDNPRTGTTRAPIIIINARAETLPTKPSFKKSLQSRRCLVVADGFYEWKTVPGRKTKVPMRIVLKNREPFAFAGLWDLWKDPKGGDVHSFTIITTECNDLVRPIHDRMPVILLPDAEGVWLDPHLQDPAKLVNLSKPYPPDLMEAFEVSPLVNTPKNDVRECLLPVNSLLPT